MRRPAAAIRLYAACWKAVLALRRTPRTVRVGSTESRFHVATRTEYVRATKQGGERHVLRAFLDALDGDETVWDVGACVGTYACFAIRRGDHVVAFEPEPTNRERLRQNLRANAPAERWTVTPIALGREHATASLRSETTELGGGHHYVTPERSVESGIEVQTVSGDELVERGVPAPDVLKIDVQGAELDVLDGLTETLNGVETVFVEVHERKCDRYGASPEDVERLLDRLGFTRERLADPSTNRDGVYFLRATSS
ncbi:FkbM family methyltransferase [Haloarcula amylovorans]|uniref:FkbM family methyltransferase n=1 Tax=Haloarcula amylovorans TaxID=2562280 RepID=UPI001076B4EF|nr:FkbM family methyltransferase [Halomicroarcula amylolytica]